MRAPIACFALSASLAWTALAAPARAQSDDDRATARALGQDGQQALDSKDYRTAEDRFRRADKLVHAPTLMLGLARALAAEGKYVEAQETYNRMVREGVSPGAPDVFKRAVEDAKREVDAVAPKVCAVTITVKGAGGGEIADPKVVLDDHPINSASLGVRRAINPGPHVLRASAEGYKSAEVPFSVLEGGSIDEPMTLEKEAAAPSAPVPVAPTPAPLPPAPSSYQSQGALPAAPPPSSGGGSAVPWVVMGLGGAGLIVGGVTGLLAVGDHSTLETHCTNGSCPPSENGNLSAYHTMGLLSTIGFIAGGVGVATGVILLIASPHKSDSGSAAAPGIRVSPVLGLGTLGAVGTF